MEETAAPSDATAVAPPVVFRGKKRKTYRRRAGDEEEEGLRQGVPTAGEAAAPRPVATTAAKPGEDDESALSMAEVVRRRNTRRSRLRGVGFGPDDAGRGETTTAEKVKSEPEEDSLSQMIREEQERVTATGPPTDLVGGMSNRFTAQTGLSGELVNKAMTEFIESELAKRHSAAYELPDASWAQSGSSSDDVPARPQPSSTGPSLGRHPEAPTRNPQAGRMHGKLMEIDLGEEARKRNEAMTERARRKLQGEAIADDEPGGPAKKVRLGRDGKPWRPRGRRDSDALKRDQLVEEILKETKLDIYETPAAPTGSASAPNKQKSNNDEDDDVDEGAADDRIAEEFRRDFLDAMAQRQRRRRRPVNAVRTHKPGPKPGAKKEDDAVLRGPKLGGSRNTRAAMRDLLLKQQEAKKK